MWIIATGPERRWESTARGAWEETAGAGAVWDSWGRPGLPLQGHGLAVEL